MRIAAGILMIIGGLIGATLLIGIGKWIGIPWMVGNLLGFCAGIGGYYTLKRERWGWALAGAICSLLFPFFGIPALILLIKSRGEFSR